jgi:hypothetical protein
VVRVQESKERSTNCSTTVNRKDNLNRVIVAVLSKYQSYKYAKFDQTFD